jgi:3-dehydroquinate synthase
MNKTAEVEVTLTNHSYKIHIGTGIISQIPDLLPFKLDKRNCFIISDDNISNSYADTLYKTLKGTSANSVELLSLPSGEKTKSFVQLESILHWLIDKELNRESIVFALGGGVVGDIAGMAASLAMRGVKFVQIPTTLLAQVDSSVGGKTGINLPQGKNLIGTFYQPEAVICDIDTLQSLPQRELKAGYAEILKYGLLGDSNFFIWLEANGQDVCNRDSEALIKAIEVSCKKKAEIVSADEKEKGVRALLNLGHTFGHALEKACEYDGRLLHGEAVSIGTIMASRLSVRMGVLKETEVDRIIDHMHNIGLPLYIKDISPPLNNSVEEIISFMKKDKKATTDTLKFILLKTIGNAYISDEVHYDDLVHILQASMLGK